MLIKIVLINPFYSKTQNILKCIKWYTETYGIEQFETAGNVPFGTANLWECPLKSTTWRSILKTSKTDHLNFI